MLLASRIYQVGNLKVYQYNFESTYTIFKAYTSFLVSISKSFGSVLIIYLPQNNISRGLMKVYILFIIFKSQTFLLITLIIYDKPHCKSYHGLTVTKKVN